MAVTEAPGEPHGLGKAAFGRGRLEPGRGQEDLPPKILCGMRNMQTDPDECREHAQRCHAQVKSSYLDTARAWEQLAIEIEGAQAFVKTLAEIGGRVNPRRPSRGGGSILLAGMGLAPV